MDEKPLKLTCTWCGSIYDGPPSGRAGDGMADYMDRIAAIGNGQIPTVAASAWHILLKRLGEK